MSNTDIFDYIEGNRVDETNIDSLLEKLRIDDYRIKDLRKLESMCNIISRISKNDEDKIYYKTKEVEILERETNLEDENDDFLRLARAYEQLSDLFNDEDKKRANFYLEKEIEIINFLEIEEKEKNSWLKEIRDKKLRYIPKTIDSLEEELKKLDESVINSSSNYEKEILMGKKADIYKNLTKLYEEEHTGGLEKFFESKDKEIKNYKNLFELNNNIRCGFKIIFLMSDASKKANDCDDMEKKEYFLKEEFDFINGILNNSELNERSELKLKKCLFYATGHLGNAYRTLEKNKMAIKYKRKEIDIGFDILEDFKNINEKDEYTIKERLIYASGFAARMLKKEGISLIERIEETKNENNKIELEKEKNDYFEESIYFKLVEKNLLEDELIKKNMDKDTRLTYLVQNLSTLARLNIEFKNDDTDYLLEACEKSKEISEDTLKKREKLLETLEFITYQLSIRFPGEGYLKKNKMYKEIRTKYFPEFQEFYEQE